jgi:hypothetical protein
MVEAEAARVLGLDVGRVLQLEPRSGSADAFRAEVSGHYTVVDPFGPYWQGKDRLNESLTLSSSFRTVSMITDRGVMLGGLSPRPEVGVLAIPRFELIGLHDVEPLSAGISRLETRLNTQLQRDLPEVMSEFDVVTSAPSVLFGRDRTLTVARSVITAIVMQLAVLAAFALVLVAGLGVDTRRAEAATVRARGASASQLVTQAVLDAAAIVLPMAILAPYLAAKLVGLVDRLGPFTASGLVVAPRIVDEAWIVVGVAAVLTVALLAWPALHAARIADASTQRRRRTGGLQRSGVDIAVLILAAVAYWQLRTLGGDRAATVRGRFGVDPILIVAPTFGLIAGAFIALRLVPVGARLAERLIDRGRSATIALSGWQLARRPDRYTRTGLLLIMAIAVGTFATAYESTWTASQEEQANHEIGADGRLAPNQRTGDSIGPLHLASALETVPGVVEAMAVVDADVSLPVSTQAARLIAVDASRPQMFDDVRDASGEITLALAALAERRPAMVGLPLPGEPIRLDITLNVEPAAGLPDDPEEIEVPLAGSVRFLIRDGNGLLHRVDAGLLGVGRVTRSVELVMSNAATPAYPLSLLDIEFSTAAQGPLNRPVLVAVEPVEVIDATGSASLLALDSVLWQPRTEVLGFLSQPASLTFESESPVGGLGLRIAPGATQLSVPVIHTVTPSNAELPSDFAPPQPLPAVANVAWMDRSDTELGDVVALPLGRGDDVLVELVGAVESVPTVNPDEADAVLVDLPTLMWLERGPGRPVRAPSEYWVLVEDDADALVDALFRPPIEAVDVKLVSDREAELTTDPPALSAIGAMAVGFVAAAVFAIAGFVVTALVSARERRTEFALLHALGLTARQHRRWMLIEQIVLVIVSLVIGTLLGLTLARLVLPVVSLSQDGSNVFPPVTVRYPWSRILVLELTLIGGLVVAMVGARLLRFRGSIGSAIRRLGDQ